MITVVDYGVGNIGSLLNMFDYLGVEAKATDSAKEIDMATRLVLPGVGAFDNAMKNLKARSLVESLSKAVLDREVPILGICLGMQLFSRKSEEGQESGLGWINADVKKLMPRLGSNIKVPHVGWKRVALSRPSDLFQNSQSRFYFVHGYHVVCDDENDILATVDYDGPICCSVHKKNIIGVQFHPEKSHVHGINLLRAFIRMG